MSFEQLQSQADSNTERLDALKKIGDLPINTNPPETGFTVLYNPITEQDERVPYANLPAGADGNSFTSADRYDLLSQVNALDPKSITTQYVVDKDGIGEGDEPEVDNNGFYTWDGTSATVDFNRDLGLEKTDDFNDTTGKVIEAQAVKPINDAVNGVVEIVPSINLFNEDDIVFDEYVGNNGNIFPGAGWARSPHIPIEAGVTYTLSGNRGRRGLAYYDGVNLVAIANTFENSPTLPHTTTAPAGATHIVFNVYQASDQTYSNLQLVVGSVATDYVEFGDSFKIKNEALNTEQSNATLVLNNGSSDFTNNELTLNINGKELKQQLDAFPNPNTLPFDTRNVYYDGALISSRLDEAAPYRIDGGTIGAGHDLGSHNFNKTLKYYVDSNLVTDFSNTYNVNNNVSVIESYDIDGNDTSGLIANVTNTYVFDIYGGITIYADIYGLQSVDLRDIMFLMSNSLELPYSNYIPKTLPLTHESVNYDFSLIEDMAGFNPSTRIDFTPARCEPSGILADRFVQIKDDICFAIGYIPVKDAGITRRREVATEKAMQLSNTEKIYMSAIDPVNNTTTLGAGDYYSVIGYKTFFTPQDGFTASYFVNTSQGVYGFFDWHASYNGKIDVRTDLFGKSVTLIEKSSNVNLLTSESAEQMRVDVNISSDYGYLIVKID